MKKCLIIGYGWLGKPLVDSLLKEGNEVWATTTLEEKGSEMLKNGINPFVLTSEFGQITWQNKHIHDFDVVILLWPPFDQVLPSMKTVFANLRFKTLVFTSSTGVYFSSNAPITEDSPIDVTHKAAMMELFIQDHIDSKVVILRLAGHIGPGRHPLNFMLRSQKPLSNGDTVVNLVQQTDMIQAIKLATTIDFPSGIYNVCAPEHPTRAEYYGGLAKKWLNQDLQIASGNIGKLIDGTKITRESSFEYSHSITDIDELDFIKDNI